MPQEALRIGIYAPYLNTVGGGEKYIATIAELLSQTHSVDFLTTHPVDLVRIQDRLHVDLSRVNITPVLNSPTEKRRPLSGLARKWAQVRAVSDASKNYDLFLNQETLTAIPCQAARGVVICQIPPHTFNPSTSVAANLARLVGAYLFLDPQLKSYAKVIVYSQFVAAFAQNFYQKETLVVHPPVDIENFSPLPKQNVILSVGRFFVGIHNKKQIELIRQFKLICDQGLPDPSWSYHLVGSIDSSNAARHYVDQCKAEAQGYPIVFHFDAPFAELRRLYGQAKLFWHGAGMGEDVNRHPERAEHFGIATVEAMAAGCVPIVINKGGQPEIVRHGIDGLCWNTADDLRHYTQDLMVNESARIQWAQAALVRSKNFAPSVFRQTLLNSLEL